MLRSSTASFPASRAQRLSPRVLLLLFATALAVRVLYVCFAADNTTIGTWMDAGPAISLNLLHGRGYVMSWDIAQNFRSFRTPGWPLLLYGIWSVVGCNLLAPKLVLALLGALSCLWITLLGARLFDARVGALAGWGMAFCTTLIRWTGTLGMETLAVFCLTLGVYLVCAPPARLGLWRYLPAGLALGLLCLTRPIWMVYVALVFGLLWITRRRERADRMGAAVLAGAVALVMLPWVARNAIAHRALVVASTDGGLAFVEANNPVSLAKQGDWVPGYAASLPEVARRAPTLSEAQFNSWMMQKGWATIRAQPLAFGRVYLLRLGYLWKPSPPAQASADLGRKHLLWMNLYWGACYALMIVALVLLRPWKDARQWPVLLIFLWACLSIPLFSFQLRYRAPVEPFSLLYGAAGAFALLDRVRGPRSAARQKT